MATFISNSAEQTEAFGERLGRTLPFGCVVGLIGELGAGKTQFVKGFARGLGVTDRVHSPTFALLNVYTTGRFPLFHLDLYRLDSDEQVMGAGLEEYFAPAGISVVEWMDRWQGKPPACYHRVQIEVLNERDRRIVYDEYDDAGA